MPSKNQKKSRRSQRRRESADIPHLNPLEIKTAGKAALGLRIGFPAERTVVLNYCELTSAATTGGLIVKQQYKINSAFDPNYTGVGHQPMGFDEWATFYQHYVVEHCEYEVQLATPNAGCTYVAAHLSDDNVIANDIGELEELGASVGVITPYTQGYVLRGKVDIAKFFNRSNIASDSTLRALTSQNPTDTAFLSVCCQPADGISVTTVFFNVILRMRVRFMEPRDLAPSVSIGGSSLPNKGDEAAPAADEGSPPQPVFPTLDVPKGYIIVKEH